jgi:hypothetical protein
MIQNYHDGIVICCAYEPPDLFITFTCNIKWPEIAIALLPGEYPNDRADVIVRVFHMKLEQLLDDLCSKKNIWPNVSYIIFNRILKKRTTTCTYITVDRQKWNRNSIRYNKLVDIT